MEEVKVKIGIDDQGFANGLKRDISQMEQLSATAKKSGMSIDDMGRHVKQLGSDIDEAADKGTAGFGRLEKAAIAFFSIQKAREFVGKVYEVRSEIEKLETSFRVLVGNKDKADALFASIRKFAVETPMQLKDLAGAAQTMMGFGIATEDVMENLKALGNVAMGDSQKFQSLALAFSQMSATGKLMGQDFLQMVNAGFNPLDQMAKTTGKSVAVLKKEMSEGAISADMVRQAFIDATSEGGKFNGMLEAQSKTMAGAYSNLQGAIDDMLNEIGQKSEGIMSGAIEVATTLAQNYETVGKVLLGLIGTYGTYKVAVMTVTAVQSLQAASTQALTIKTAAYHGWLVLTQKAQALLNATMLTNPYVLAATAIAGVATALWAMHDSTTAEEAAAKTLADRTEELRKRQEELNEKTEEAIRNATDNADATGKQEEAMQYLINKYPELIKQYIDEKGHLKDIIELKERIAELNGENQRREAMQDSYNAFEDARQIYNDWISIRKRFRENHGAWSEADRKRYNQIMELYRQQSGSRNNSGDAIEKYYHDLAMKAKAQYESQSSSNFIANFTKAGGPLEQYTDAQLKALQQTLKSMKGQETAFVKELQSTLTGEDREGLLTRVTAMMEARSAPKSTPAAHLQALKQTLDDAQQALEDFEKSNTEYTAEAAKTERERLQKAVDDAEKAYKAFGGKIDNGGGNGVTYAKENAARRQKIFEQDLSERQRQAQQLEAMKDAQANAAIANEQSRAKRELMQIEKDHQDRLNAIDRQAEEMRKANYEAEKKAWEAANADKTKSWSDTATAKDVAANGFANIKLTEEQLATLKAAEDKANADRLNAEKEFEERLVSQYQSYTDRKIEIDRQYQDDVARINAAIAKAEERGDKRAVEALKRSLAEAAKERAKSQSQLSLDQLKKTPEYVRAFEDLDNTSTETLQTLISMFEKAKEAAAGSMNPEDLREYTQTLQQLYDKVGERDPFAAMKVSAQAMRDAHKEVMEAENRLNAVRQGVSIPTSFKLNKETGEITATYLTEEEAVRQLAAAKDKEAKATNQHRAASQQAQKAINELAAAIQSVGNAMGGTAGQVLGMIGDVMTFATSCMQAITFESQATSAALRAVESASVILAVISAAIQLLQTISKLNKDAHAQYEEYAAKVSEVEQLRQAMYEYRMELIKTKQEENGWFSTTGFQELRDQWVQSSAAMAEYAETAAAAQAIYENESGGGWLTGALSWLGKAVGWIVSIPGQVVSGLLDKLGIVDKNSFLGKAIEWTTDVGFGGAEAFIGKLTGELLNAQNYAEGTVAAIKNLRVETRSSSSGFLGTGIGGHSQKTQDLQSFVKEKMGVDLFDANGVLTSVELGKRVMEEYGDKMVGETKKTMERLIELKEQYDEWQDQLREFISELYSPLADDMVDALWKWYEDGTNIMDAFKSYSTDTFRSIGKEMVKQLVNTLLFDELKEKMQALLTGYSLDAAAGQKSEEQLTQELMAGTQLQIQNLLNKAKLVAPVLQNAVQAWEDGMESMGLSTEESFENVFSSIKDNFKSMLLDMEGDVTDFGKQLKKAMYEALLERFVMKAPVTVTIDGEQQTFDSLNSYLDNWQKRANEVAQTMSATEHDTQKSSLEEQIAALEAERKANLEARQQVRNRDGLQSQYDYYYQQYGWLVRGGTPKTEEEKKIQERMLAMQKELNERSAPYDERNKEIYYRLVELRKQLAEIEASETLTDEERTAKIEELNAELEEQLAISKQIAKTYADMAGWTMEMKIDASPLANLGDELLSVLQDTSKGVDDWKKELVEAMTNDLIKEVVYNADFEKSIRDLQEQYVNIMSSDMSAEEKAAAIQKIADAIAALYNTADEKVDGLKNIVPDIDTSPFNNLRDTILDTFTDIEADAKDFRKSLEKTLVKDLLEKMVLDVPLTVTIDGEDKIFEGGFDEYGKDWNNRYLNAVKALQEARKGGDAEVIAEAQAAVDALLDEVEGVYTQLEEGADEFRQRLKEIANDTTFTDMADSLVSSLMDVEGNVEDIANDMKKTIVKKLVEAFMVSDAIKPLLDELQATFNAVMGMEGLTPEQRAQMMKAGFTGTDAEGNEKVFLGIDDEGVTQRLTDAQAAIKTLMEAIGYEFDKKEGFSDLRGAFISALTDMEGDASTFGKNIGKTMAEQMLDAYIDKTYKDQIAALNEEWAAALDSGNPAQIEAIRQKVLALYATIGNDEQVKQLTADVKELQKQLDTTFSDMGDDWASALTDMDSTAEDWGRQIGRSLTQKLVKELVVTKQLQKYLDDIQTAYNDAIGQEGATINSVLAAVIPKIDAAVTATERWKPVAEEIAKRFQELDNSTPLDNLRSTVLSQLMNIEGDTEDFARSINEILTEAFIDKFVMGEAFDKKLEEWKEQYRAIMKGGYSKEERADLLKQLRNAISAEEANMAQEAQAIHEFMGTANYQDQTATMNMSDKATYEQMDQYLSVQMGIYMVTEQILTTLRGGTTIDIPAVTLSSFSMATETTAKQILSAIQTMKAATNPDSSTIQEMRNMMATGNEYLLDIKRSNREILTKFGAKLDSINGKLAKL